MTCFCSICYSFFNHETHAFFMSSFIVIFLFILFQYQTIKRELPRWNSINVFLDKMKCKFQKKFDGWWSESLFKGYLMLRFSLLEDFTEKRVVKTGRAPVLKWLRRPNLKLCTHVSNRLLHKRVVSLFSNNDLFIFIAINWRDFKACFAYKLSRADNSKGTWKEKNRE